jgi:hypothetical protein
LQCVAVVVDESGRRITAIFRMLALSQNAMPGSTVWPCMLRRSLEQGGCAVRHPVDPEAGPRLGDSVVLVDDLATAIEAVGGHVMAAMDLAGGLILGQGRL